MRFNQLMLATVGLFVVTGVTDAGRAEMAHTTLYTPVTRAGTFNCNVLNVSRRTLSITISFLNQDGDPYAVSDPIPTRPGAEASDSFGTLTVNGQNQAIDGYCKVEVSGTSDRDDLRVLLNTGLVRTFDEGTETNIPLFVFRGIAGY